MMFDENEFKKAQEQAKKGKKVDVPNSVLSRSKSKTQTAKKSKQKVTNKETQSSSQQISVQNSSVSSSENKKEELSVGPESNSLGQKGQNFQEQFFSTEIFEKVLKEMPTQTMDSESNVSRDKLSHLQSDIRKLKQELKNIVNQNDVLMKLLEAERSKNAFLIEQQQNLESKYQEEWNKNVLKQASKDDSKDESKDISVQSDKANVSVQSENEDVPQNIQDLSATIFSLRQSNTNLLKQIEQGNTTLSSLEKECSDLRQQIQELQHTNTTKTDEKEVSQSATSQDLERKQLVKILHSNGCRDIEEQMDFVRKFSQSQHLLFWLRKLYVKDFQDFETLVEKKMYKVRDGIDISLHDAIFVKTTAKNCEISAGEDISLYAREFQNGFLVNGFRYGQVIGCREKIIPLAKTFLLHHALQINWETKFVPYNRRQIYIFWNLSKDETSNSIVEEAFNSFGESQIRHFWDGHVVASQESLFLMIEASNLALFFRRAAKKINNWQPI